MSDTADLRFLVFCLDNEHGQHDGIICKSEKEAVDYALDSIESHQCDKAITASFILDSKANHVMLHEIEIITAKGRKRKNKQISIFGKDYTL